MVYRKATYEEYQEASRFAKFRYKYGVFIQTIAFILLILLFAYAAINIEEMKAHPKAYAEGKLGVMCFYPMQVEQPTGEVNLDGDVFLSNATLSSQ